MRCNNDVHCSGLGDRVKGINTGFWLVRPPVPRWGDLVRLLCHRCAHGNMLHIIAEDHTACAVQQLLDAAPLFTQAIDQSLEQRLTSQMLGPPARRPSSRTRCSCSRCRGRRPCTSSRCRTPRRCASRTSAPASWTTQGRCGKCAATAGVGKRVREHVLIAEPEFCISFCPRSASKPATPVSCHLYCRPES